MKLSVLASVENENTTCNDFSEQSDNFFRIGSYADTLGYSTIFLFKNSANRKNLVNDPLLLQAALAPTVKTLRLGVGFAPFSFLDPISLADSCGTLDVVSRGRVTIAIDEGVRLRENLAINLGSLQQDRQNKANRELLCTALRGERFTTRSVNRRATNMQIAVRPIQTPHPPIYTAVYDKQAAREAGTAGFRIFLSPLAAMGSMDQIAEIITAYRSAQEKARLAQHDDDIIAFCLTLADTDNNRAVDRAHVAFNRHALVRPNWICRAFDEAMDLSYFLVGGPAALSLRLQRLREIGLKHVALMPTFGGLGINEVLETMRIAIDACVERPESSAIRRVANYSD